MKMLLLNQESLFDAMAWVESKNNPNAVRDNGAAIGAYQIYVDDVNRILGGQVFICKDRYDPAKSREMIFVCN